MSFFDRFKRRRVRTYLEEKEEVAREARTHLSHEQGDIHNTALLAAQVLQALTEMQTKAIDLHKQYHRGAQLVQEIRVLEEEFGRATKAFDLHEQRRIIDERDRLHEEQRRLAAKVADFHEAHGELERYIEMVKHLSDLEQKLLERIGHRDASGLNNSIRALDKFANAERKRK